MMSVNFDVPTNQSDVSESVKSSPVAHSVLWVWGRDSDAYRVSVENDKDLFSSRHGLLKLWLSTAVINVARHCPALYRHTE